MPLHDDWADTVAYTQCSWETTSLYRDAVLHLFYRGGWLPLSVLCSLLEKLAFSFAITAVVNHALPEAFTQPVPVWWVFLLSGFVAARMVLLGLIQDRISLFNRTCPGATLRWVNDAVSVVLDA